MDELEYLYNLKTDLINKYQHGISMLNSSSFNLNSFSEPVNEKCNMIEQEIKYVDAKIYNLQKYNYSNSELRNRIKNEIYSSIIEEPEYILSCIKISDIERFLRYKKLNKINKKSN